MLGIDGVSSGAFALRQDGYLYNYGYDGNMDAAAFASWTAVSADGLVASQFRRAVADPLLNGYDPNLNPDFSASGSVIEFGFSFGIGAHGPTGSNFASFGVDNWSVDVNRASAPVPEPGTLALTGVAACALLLRRRRSS